MSKLMLLQQLRHAIQDCTPPPHTHTNLFVESENFPSQSSHLHHPEAPPSPVKNFRPVDLIIQFTVVLQVQRSDETAAKGMALRARLPFLTRSTRVLYASMSNAGGDHVSTTSAWKRSIRLLLAVHKTIDITCRDC